MRPDLVQAGAVKLQYFEHGTGPELLMLVHGYQTSGRIWRLVQEALDPSRFRSLAFNNRGVVYPKPADNSISAKTGKTAMNSATSSCHMAQGNALARFHRVRCLSASKAPRTAHPLALYPRSLWFALMLLGSNRLPVGR